MLVLFTSQSVGQTFLSVLNWRQDDCLAARDRQECLTHSFLQTTNISDERVDFLLREFLPVGRHLTLAVHNGIEYAFVAHSTLPLGIGKIASVIQFSLERFGAPIFTVTRSAVFQVQLRCTPDANVARLTGRGAHGSTSDCTPKS